MSENDTNGNFLAGLVAAQLRDCETTVAMLGRFPPHISRLSARYTAILLREGVIHLPRDARGVRIRLEMLNAEGLSQPSFELVCALVRTIVVPSPLKGTPAYRVASAIFRELIASAV